MSSAVQNDKAAIPTDTVRAVKDAGMVKQIDYRPSRERELRKSAQRCIAAYTDAIEGLL